jgi:Cu-Zn family superoxide dismutase
MKTHHLSMHNQYSLVNFTWRQTALVCASVLAVALLSACQSPKPPPVTSAIGTTPVAPPLVATAELNPTQGSTVKGRVTFTKMDTGVRILADVTGLAPGKHGFHIHDKGDCSAPDAMSAGGHFNPYGTTHGGPLADMRHIGDLGNLTADAQGHAHLDVVDVRISFEGLSSILGHAVIVHAQPDDLVSQPVGNAGPRLACGVIELRK